MVKRAQDMAKTASAGTHTNGGLNGVPVHPLLFAAYPVLLLYSDNLVEVPVTDVFVPMLVVIGVACATWFGIELVARDWRRAAILTTSLLVPALLFGSIADLVEPGAVPGRLQDVRGPLFALAVTALSVVLGGILATRRKLTRPLTQALNYVAVILVVLAIVPVIGVIGSSPGTGKNPTSDARPVELNAGADPPRDIYHLVFDRYGSATALEAGLQIDNSDFLQWLEANGFQVVRDARANHLKTTMSLASTLSISLLEDVAEAMTASSSDLMPVYDRIRKSAVGTALQRSGYRYIHLGSWYDWTRGSDVADSVRGLDEYQSFASTVLRRSILAIGLVPMRDYQELSDATASFQFAELNAIVSEPGPKYVFAHILLPHPPFVYLADGTYAPGEATFGSQLQHLNSLIRDFLDPIMALPEDQRPIIILQADEGPYPTRFAEDQRAFDWATATDDELVTKFGILNAMYLPGEEGRDPLPEGMTAVNTYPELFRRYFGAAIEYLPDRSFTSNEGRPYGLTDVTERLSRAVARSAAVDPS